jgi:hypothetical protein
MLEPPRGTAPDRKRLGPYSRTLERGAIGNSIDGRSREGRFLRAFEQMLAEHVGGSPSAAQRVLISRCARLALRLELLDEKQVARTLTEHDGRTYSSLSNHLRLGMREIGIKAAEAPQLSIRDRLIAEAEARDEAEVADICATHARNISGGQ